MRYLYLDWQTKKALRQWCQDKAFAEVAKRDFGTPKVVFMQNLLKIASIPELLEMPELHPSTRDVILDCMWHMCGCRGAAFVKEAIRYYKGLPIARREPNYTCLLKNDGVLDVPAHHHGRKAGKSAWEKECSENDRDWLEYWLQLGGFRHIYEKDANGWNPMHHALDSLTFSPYRAKYAAKAIIAATDERYFDEQTWGISPKAFAPIHFACDGSERYSNKPDIVEMLLEKRANPELRDEKGNTALLLAAGSGLGNVAEILIEKGVDRYVENKEGKTALNLALGCKSRQTQKFLIEAGVPYNRHVTPREKREGKPDSNHTESVSDVVRRWCAPGSR